MIETYGHAGDFKSGEVTDEVAKALYYDGLQLTDVKLREQAVPPPAVVGFNRAASAAKDRSPIARVDPDRALVSLKEMPITMVEASDDAGEVACRKIGGLSVVCPLESTAETYPKLQPAFLRRLAIPALRAIAWLFKARASK